MDLHNNATGRNLFLQMKSEQNSIIEKLILLSENARKVTSVEEINDDDYDLVFIKD